MAIWFRTTVQTTAGDREYIFRENDETPREFWDIARLGSADSPEAGDRTYAEDWGPNLDGPYRTVTLRRTPAGWIEAA